MSQKPFNDFIDLIDSLPRWSNCARREAKDKFEGTVGKGQSCGILSDVHAWLALVQADDRPIAGQIHLCLIAASIEGGQSPEVTKRLFDDISRGRSLINRLCVPHGLGLRVLDMALDMPHRAAAAVPELDAAGTMAGVAFGMEATASGGDLIALGDMGPDSRLYAFCVIAATAPALWQEMTRHQLVTEDDVARVSEMCEPHIKAIEQTALRVRPLEVLRRLGGREMAAMCGAIAAASGQSLPLLLNGWSALAAAVVLKYSANNDDDQRILAHCMAASSQDMAQAWCWQALGMNTVLGVTGEMEPGLALPLAVSVVKASIDAHA